MTTGGLRLDAVLESGRHVDPGAGFRLVPVAIGQEAANVTNDSNGAPFAGLIDSCQGTSTFTQLVDTKCYAPDRSPRTIRGSFSAFPDLPSRDSLLLLTVAAGCCSLPASLSARLTLALSDAASLATFRPAR